MAGQPVPRLWRPWYEVTAAANLCTNVPFSIARYATVTTPSQRADYLGGNAQNPLPAAESVGTHTHEWRVDFTNNLLAAKRTQQMGPILGNRRSENYLARELSKYQRLAYQVSSMLQQNQAHLPPPLAAGAHGPVPVWLPPATPNEAFRRDLLQAALDDLVIQYTRAYAENRPNQVKDPIPSGPAPVPPARTCNCYAGGGCPNTGRAGPCRCLTGPRTAAQAAGGGAGGLCSCGFMPLRF